MITTINEAKTLMKHISCDCKRKFDSRKCDLNQKWKTTINVGVSSKIQ